MHTPPYNQKIAEYRQCIQFHFIRKHKNSLHSIPTSNYSKNKFQLQSIRYQTQYPPPLYQSQKKIGKVQFNLGLSVDNTYMYKTTIVLSLQLNQKKIIMQEIVQSPPIIDRYFLECLKKMSTEHKASLNYFTVRITIIILVLLLHAYASPPEEQNAKEAFTLFLQMLLTQNSVEMLRLLYFSSAKLKKKSEILRIATDFRHCLALQDLKQLQTQNESSQILFFEMENQWRLRVSCYTYDFENRQKITEVSEQYQQIRESVGQNAIKGTMESQISCYRPFGWLLEASSFGLFVYSIVLALQVPLPNFQSTSLQLYILLEVMLKPKLFLLVVLIALLPLILLVATIYICCCKKSQKVNLPKFRLATRQHLQKCSECSICFQTFMEGEKIIPLDCSEMHIFHETCILGWSKIKPTCPICRSEI